MLDPTFPPSSHAAWARVDAIRPGEYARTRNHLEGAVTGLSPYLAHGVLTMPDVVTAVQSRHPLPPEHKLLFEFGWREFFHHAWRHDGEHIFTSLHAGVLPDAAYQSALPADIREGRTGLPVVDHAVRALYATGYLHNHARMWLASYVVHLRKVHWRAGADWLYAHLRDGDLASNHLSWQWVAGTASRKPYLFNAENVARYAPGDWHCTDVIDQDYEALDELARDAAWRAPAAKGMAGLAEPALHRDPREVLGATFCTDLGDAEGNAIRAAQKSVAGRDVWLVHPWSLAPPPAEWAKGGIVIALLDADFCKRWPWSALRWQFVGSFLQTLVANPEQRWLGHTDALLAALAPARSVAGLGNLHLDARLAGQLQLPPMPRAFKDPDSRCQSFFAFWQRASKGLGRAGGLHRPHR
jgi:deoxyribodipyrimidine photo-lyase